MKQFNAADASNRKTISGRRALMTALIVLASSAVAAATSVSSTPQVPANSPQIVYEGRYDSDASGAVELGFPGVTVHLHFRGTRLTMQADASADELYFDVSVDGAPPTLLQLHKGKDNYTVMPADGKGEHTIALTRRNESWQGTYAILSFAFGAGGELLSAPVLPKRKLMFIGDSVTSGEMTAYEEGRDMHAKLNSNAAASYGKILARRLGAQCHLVSYGGRGIIRDWQGVREIGAAPQFYELARPDTPGVTWDHRRYVPDAVGIQLGTNDFNPGIPDQKQFVDAYVTLIEKIRHDAPEAVVFVMDSPIVTDDRAKGPRRSVLHFYLEQIVARANSPKVILAPLSHYPGVPGNGHPTGAEHAAMANELEPVIRRALGW